jgi:hypothetical protein
MALIVAVAGAYTGTWTPASVGGASGAGGGAAALGILSDDGWELSWVVHQQMIGSDGTDRYGQSLLETVYRGADWTMRFRCREYGTAAMNVAWTWGRVAGGGALAPLMGIISRLGETIAGAIILTNTTGTPAAGNPATLTAAECQMASGTVFGTTFTSKIRELPIHVVMFPYVSGADIVWFTTT